MPVPTVPPRDGDTPKARVEAPIGKRQSSLQHSSRRSGGISFIGASDDDIRAKNCNRVGLGFRSPARGHKINRRPPIASGRVDLRRGARIMVKVINVKMVGRCILSDRDVVGATDPVRIIGDTHRGPNEGTQSHRSAKLRSRLLIKRRDIGIDRRPLSPYSPQSSRRHCSPYSHRRYKQSH